MSEENRNNSRDVEGLPWGLTPEEEAVRLVTANLHPRIWPRGRRQLNRHAAEVLEEQGAELESTPDRLLIIREPDGSLTTVPEFIYVPRALVTALQAQGQPFWSTGEKQIMIVEETGPATWLVEDDPSELSRLNDPPPRPPLRLSRAEWTALAEQGQAPHSTPEQPYIMVETDGAETLVPEVVWVDRALLTPLETRGYTLWSSPNRKIHIVEADGTETVAPEIDLNLPPRPDRVRIDRDIVTQQRKAGDLVLSTPERTVIIVEPDGTEFVERQATPEEWETMRSSQKPAKRRKKS